MFGRSALNSNQSNDIKLCKKLANQKCRHMSLRRCGIQTRYCALIRRRSAQEVRASAMQASFAKQEHHSKLSLSCKKGGPHEL